MYNSNRVNINTEEREFQMAVDFKSNRKFSNFLFLGMAPSSNWNDAAEWKRRSEAYSNFID